MRLRDDGCMNVIHICDDFVTGGIESVVMDLCGTLKSSGVKTSVLFLYGHDEYPIARRTAEITPLGMERRIRMDPRGVLRLRSIAEALRPDIFHCHGYYSALAPILLRFMGIHVPVLYTVHSELQHWGRRTDFLIRRVSRWADAVTAISPQAADCISSLTDGDVTPDVVMNGIDVMRVTPSAEFCREAKRKEVGAGPGTLVFVMVATLYCRKDHPTLFEAFAKTLPQMGNVQLWLVGDGDQRGSLENLAAKLGITQETKFLGKRSDVVELLASSDVFVLSSHNEGIPISLIEAACAGLPVIATELGGIAYLKSQGLPILLVKEHDTDALSDSLLKMLDGRTRSALATSVRSQAQNLFLIQRTADDYMRLYQRLAASYRN